MAETPRNGHGFRDEAASGARPQNLRGIKLVLSDVDGTLVTPEKVLTARAVRAVDQLREAGILFALTSARPPQALSRFVEPLGLETPLGAFNGGLIVDHQMRVMFCNQSLSRALALKGPVEVNTPLIGIVRDPKFLGLIASVLASGEGSPASLLPVGGQINSSTKHFFTSTLAQVTERNAVTSYHLLFHNLVAL